MSNVNQFWDETLAAFGDSTGANNVNDFYKKLAVAVTANVVQGTAIVVLGGTIGGTANDTMTVTTDIALSTGNTYTDAAVNTAVNAALLEVRNNNADLQAKVNELIAAVA